MKKVSKNKGGVWNVFGALFLLLGAIVWGTSYVAQAQTPPATDQSQLFDVSIFDQIKTTANEYLRRSIVLNTNPQYPGPREDVVLSLSSASTDLMRANISWYLDGKLKANGIGKTTFVLRTGGVGTENSVRASIKTAEGIFTDKELVINPAGLDVVWEADTSVPPFYKGKALPIGQSTIKIAALPYFVSGAGKMINPDNLIYSWKDNNTDTKLLAASGYGKMVLRRKMSLLLRDENISVSVSSLGNSIGSQKTIIVAPFTSSVLLYEDNPIEGVLYERAVGGQFDLTKDEFSLKAEPYFFPSDDRANGKLSYVWSLNNKEVENNNKDSLVLKQGGGSGTALVRLVLKDIVSLFGESSASLSLTFKK